MTKFEEIIRYAIGLEKDSADFYESLTKRTNKPEVKQVFLEMRDEELKHLKKLEDVLENHNLPEGKKYYPDPDLQIADYVVDVDENKENLSYQDILIIAMKREKSTLDLYTVLYDEIKDPDLKKVFGFLVEEEAKHKHFFEAKFDDDYLTSN